MRYDATFKNIFLSFSTLKAHFYIDSCREKSMRFFGKKSIWAVLSIAVFLVTNCVMAHGATLPDQISTVTKDLTGDVPDLADVIPLATKLSGRLLDLENKMDANLDEAEIKDNYIDIQADLIGFTDQLKQLKDSKDYKFNQLIMIRDELQQEKYLFEKINEALNQEIGQLEDFRNEWLSEEQSWNQWQSSLLKQGPINQVHAAVEKAKKTITSALNRIINRMDVMLSIQEEAATIQTKMYALNAELESLIQSGRSGSLLSKSPPILSSEFISQFSDALWYATKIGVNQIIWPGSDFFSQKGWIIFLQGFLSLFVFIAVYRNRQVLKDSEGWEFLSERPFSAAFFLGIVSTLFIYQYEGTPATFSSINLFAGGISFARLSGKIVDSSWKKNFIYGVVTVLLINRVLFIISLPLPLYRLYLIFASLVGLFFCFRWSMENNNDKKSNVYTWVLRIITFIFFVNILMNFWGEAGIASYLLTSVTQSIAMTLTCIMFTYMLRGGLNWIFYHSPLRQERVMDSEADTIIRQISFIMNCLIFGLLLIPAVLISFGIYPNLQSTVIGVLALGFNIGPQQITIGLILVSACILYGSFFLSWTLQKLLMKTIFAKTGMEKGSQLSMSKLVHYVIVSVGFLFAISALGIDVSKLTLMLSALGVGLGFGMQGIMNNFVSGLILLFERPIRMGDSIEVDGMWAEVTHIGLRSTVVKTLDQADVIVPNSVLIANNVTNWTLSNRQIRLRIPIGVAYGSDVPLVMETLIESAKSNPMVAKRVLPQVLFLSFGDSALNFELRVWILNVDERLRVSSEINQEIERRFREVKIEIAFPQRDLHLRSVDESIFSRHPEIIKKDQGPVPECVNGI